MKVLLLVPEFCQGQGGIKVFNNFLVKALIELGHSLCIISINDTENHFSAEYSFFRSGNYRYLRKPMFIVNILRQTFRYSPDIIFCGHVNFAPLCLVLFKILKIPYITFTHGIDSWHLKWLKLFGLRNSSKILAVSRFTRQRILKQLPNYTDENMIILPNTFDSERFKPSSKPQYLIDKWKIKGGDKVLLTIARLSSEEQYKGYDKVILVLKDVIKEMPDIKYIIGGSGDDKERLEKLIVENSLESTVILPGLIPEEELADYYNLCDLFIMPSKGEGFGIVFLEALACGKPVIAGNKDGSANTLMDGELGLLVDPENICQIKDAIISVLNNTVSKQLVDAEYLRERTSQIYGFNGFKEKMKNLLESCNHE